MRVKKFDTLTQLTLMASWFPVNCYLVEEEDSVTLIDAALAFGAKGIAAAIRATGKPLTHIVLTHAHDDHVGALDRLKEEFPEAKVVISKRDAKLMVRDLSLEPGEAEAPIRGGVPKGLKTRPDLTIQDGDRIGSLLAIAAPGHTPGSMAFLDTRTNALIAGDAFQTRGRSAVSGQFVWSFPFPAFATWHAATATKSAKRLRDLAPTLLAVGHGEVILRPTDIMTTAIEAAEAAQHSKQERSASNVTKSRS